MLFLWEQICNLRQGQVLLLTVTRYYQRMTSPGNQSLSDKMGSIMALSKKHDANYKYLIV